jgi:aldose 1-epimerase
VLNTLLKGYIEKDFKIGGHDSIVLKYTDRQTDIEVKISPFFGSNIYKFKYNGNELFYCDYDLLKKRDWTGCFILWPYPNRIRDKKFEFEGKNYSLVDIKRKKGNYPLIHGLVDDKIWKISGINKTKNSIKASTFIDVSPRSEIYKYFPFKSRLTLSFTVDKSGLRIEYFVINRSTINMPFGFALHPYFLLLSGADKTRILLPAEKVMETDQELLPTGKLYDVNKTKFNLKKPFPLLNLSLDHVFTCLDRSKMPYIDFQDNKIKINLESSKDFTHMVLYTMEKKFICFENQTGSTDMINLHNKGIKGKKKDLIVNAHLLVLKPGHTHKGFVNYEVIKY